MTERCSRNKLGEAFIQDLCDDWKEHGPSVNARVRAEEPSVCLRVVVGVLPKELLVKEQTIADMTDAEVAEALEAVRAFLRANAEPVDAPKLIEATPADDE
jgi:hypothetical protein